MLTQWRRPTHHSVLSIARPDAVAGGIGPVGCAHGRYVKQSPVRDKRNLYAIELLTCATLIVSDNHSCSIPMDNQSVHYSSPSHHPNDDLRWTEGHRWALIETCCASVRDRTDPEIPSLHASNERPWKIRCERATTHRVPDGYEISGRLGNGVYVVPRVRKSGRESKPAHIAQEDVGASGVDLDDAGVAKSPERRLE